MQRERTGHSKHPLPTTQEKTLNMDFTIVSTEIRLIIFFSAKVGEALYSQQKQYWELTVAQSMSSLLPNSDKLKKVGKTTRPFKYDLNQIPYDYTVEVRNRFKGLDLIDRVPGELWTVVCDTVQDQNHPHGKEMQKSKMAVWGGLTNSCEEKQKAKEKRKDISM